MSTSRTTSFKVDPHLLEDFGLNLYSDLPRVLIEYLANAHDADSTRANVSINFDEIKRHREHIRTDFRTDRKKFESGTLECAPTPLEMQTLPETLTITIADDGFGMTEDELQRRFLVAGRKRRIEEEDSKSGITPGGRLLMGRKGLGKLAGFGVAKTIEVVTKKRDEPHATRIILDFDSIRKYKAIHQVPIPIETLSDGGGIDKSGTRVTLSRLLHEPAKSKPTTISDHIAEHFEMICRDEFDIQLNDNTIPQPSIKYAFAYPEDDTIANNELVLHELPTDEGTVKFKYRIRFRESALSASKRGVRIYTHRRLAAAPSLLDTDPNTHGFRQADYLDGVVQADFIDEQPNDYIATDRQSLRWETVLLAPLHKFLSKQMAAACRDYQYSRDARVPDQIKEDKWTQDLINGQHFSGKERRFAERIAATLSKALDEPPTSSGYRNRLEPIINGIGQGAMMKAISDLAAEQHPSLQKAAIELTRLTKDQFDRSVKYIHARVAGIDVLRKIVKDVNFKDAENEKTIQKLFEQSPWLVDPMFSNTLSSDTQFIELFDRLAHHLEINEYAKVKDESDSRRPDLVFLVGNMMMRRLIIVELKSANTALNSNHLDQLEEYIETAENWLASQKHKDINVTGELIGTMPKPESTARLAQTLRRRIRNAGPSESWQVRDYTQVLSDTKAVHKEVLRVYEAGISQDHDEDSTEHT